MTETVASGHLSIGEVLALVQADFPDVTISKIRFLESQGLIAPERTASGYRKFYDSDIERLRWILSQQRDHFLPLKVIKRMLDQGTDGSGSTESQPSLFPGPADDPAESGGPDLPAVRAPEPPRSSTPQSPSHPAVKSSPKRHSTPADVVAALQEDPRSVKSTRQPRPSSGGGAVEEEESEAVPPSKTTGLVSRAGALGEPGKEEPVTRDELISSCGVGEELLAELETYGLIRTVMRGGAATYDAESQLVVRAATRYVELGVEPRHLRMYKVAAEREAGFVEQLVMPLLRQRNPASKELASTRTDELLALGAQLHASLLRRQLGPVLES